MSDAAWPTLLDQAWRAVAGDDAPNVRLRVDGDVSTAQLPSTLPVADTAIACVGAALRAGALLTGAVSTSVSAAHVASAVRSEAYLRVNGQPLGPGFAPLSRFWRTEDGWVRTHANYPWHRAALCRALGLNEQAVQPDDVAEVLSTLSSVDVERRVVEAGGVASAMRTPEQWRAHPHGRVVAEQPLLATTRYPAGEPRRARTAVVPSRAGGPGALPAEGVRVLDLTRVIAGPVCTRFLGALGADVLRLDSPHRPELEIHRYDGLPGKRSALLDLATPDGLERLHALLDGADVLVHGYRPGALVGFGLDGDSLAGRHPGLVVVGLSAWGSNGPWGARRGFDSIVQVASGIAARESVGDGRPGALPCQLLDHGTGYLCAAAVLDGLRRQRAEGGTFLREASLARTAHWLLGEPVLGAPIAPAHTQRTHAEPVHAQHTHSPSGAASGRGRTQPAREAATVGLVTLPSPAGPVTTVAPPGALDEVPLHWPDLPVAYGESPAQWRYP